MRGRCDHNPTAPRLALVVDAIPNQPKFNRDAIDRAPRLYERPHLFPELTGHAIVGRGTRLRARRSSRREAWALMAASIARHTDNRSFVIGDPRGDGLFNGVSVRKYMADTGLSRYRVNATLREFEGAAFIVTAVQPVEALQEHRPGCERKGRCACPPLLDASGKQRHRAFAAQRRVTDLFFHRFAFTADRIERARTRAFQAWRRRREPPASAVAILEGRRAVSKLVKNNRRRNRRLERGQAPGGRSQNDFPPGATPERLAARNAERENRLEQLFRPDTGPPPKPSGSR